MTNMHSHDLAVAIDSSGIAQYLNARLASISDRLVLKSTEMDQDMIDELKRFGIESLADLDRRILTPLLEHWSSVGIPQTYFGILRDVMMYDDVDRYFDKAWMRDWTGLDIDSYELLSSKYGESKLDEVVDRYSLIIDYEPDRDEPDVEPE